MKRMMDKNNWKKAYDYLRRNGIGPTLSAIGERTRCAYYADYRYEKPNEEVLSRQQKRIWKNPIRFSILVPAYETRELFMEQLVKSLQEQTYPYWELLLLDASKTDRVKRRIEAYQDERIRYLPLAQNQGISENTQAGLALVRGEYVGLLDHDDYLTPDALYEMANQLEQGRQQGYRYRMLYSDEDKCEETGTCFFEPHWKQDFNLDLLLTNNYICHFLVMERELISKLGFRKAFDGAKDYDLVLRAVADLLKEETAVEQQIAHIPRVLYHWRCHEASTAANPSSKDYAYEAGRRALEDFLLGMGWKAKVSPMRHKGFYRVDYEGGIFAQRKDVAAIGGKRIYRGKVLATAKSKTGEPLYEGLPAGYSGYMNRAVLMQDVEWLDTAFWKVNPLYQNLLEEVIQEAKREQSNQEEGLADQVCAKLLARGYRLCWDPEWILSQKEGGL